MEATKALNLVLLILFILLFITVINPIKRPKKRKSKSIREPIPLTIEKLKKYKGLENITDEEAKNVLHTFKIYSELTFNLFQEQKTKNVII